MFGEGLAAEGDLAAGFFWRLGWSWSESEQRAGGDMAYHWNGKGRGGEATKKLLYSSHFPFTILLSVEMLAEQIDGGIGDLFDEEEVDAVYYKPAEKLLETNGK